MVYVLYFQKLTGEKNLVLLKNVCDKTVKIINFTHH